MSARKTKFIFNSVLNFRRVFYFWLCLLETQVLVNYLSLNNNAVSKTLGFSKVKTEFMFIDMPET